MLLVDKLLLLAKQLYPTGRAFNIQPGGYLEGLHKALGLSEARAYNDAKSILGNLMPDTDGFTADDTTDWERRLGIVTNLDVSIENRNAAIRRKMNFPGGQPARQNYLFIQGQLQLAGFDVWVHENIFPDGMGGFISKTPLEVYGVSALTDVQYGDGQYGDNQYGQRYTNKIANYIEENRDIDFLLGGDLTATFFIGGEILGTLASVPIERKIEFRQLLLQLKPVSTVGFLFINYV